jgi:excisionase family DNA binding protein
MRRDDTTPNDTIIGRLRHRTSYLSSTEVMEILGVTRNTLCAWVRSNAIPAVRVGKDNKFDPLQLAAWLEERRV